MATTWPVDELVGEARTLLLRSGLVRSHMTVLDVRAEAERLVVEFRWKMDPHRYVVCLPLPESRAESPLTGRRIYSSQEWAGDVSMLLDEAFSNGYFRRAERVQREDGLVELKYPAPPMPVRRSTFDISDVPLYRGTGGWLTDIGLQIGAPLQAYDTERLICWKQACLRSLHAPTVGHVAASRHLDRLHAVHLDAFGVVDGAPDETAAALLDVLMHEAAEAGGTLVYSSLKDPALVAYGFAFSPEHGVLIRDLSDATSLPRLG